jgi:hypothetical protein
VLGLDRASSIRSRIILDLGKLSSGASCQIEQIGSHRCKRNRKVVRVTRNPIRKARRYEVGGMLRCKDFGTGAEEDHGSDSQRECYRYETVGSLHHIFL